MQISVVAAIVVIIGLVTTTDAGNSKCDLSKCAAVLCKNITQADCEPTEIFRPSGYKCECCPRCVMRAPCDESLCDKLTCALATRKDCKRGQIFRPRGYRCNCCAYCEDMKASNGGGVITGACDFTTCIAAQCVPVTARSCTPAKIFRPRGYKCNCCPYCEDRAVSDRSCDGINCALVRCADILPSDCTADQIFLEADEICRCCNSCVSRKGRA